MATTTSASDLESDSGKGDTSNDSPANAKRIKINPKSPVSNIISEKNTPITKTDRNLRDHCGNFELEVTMALEA